MIVSLLPVPALLMRMSAPPKADRSDAEVFCDTRCFCVRAVGLARHDDNMNSFCGQTLRNCKADTYTAAGDNGHFVF